MDRDLRNALILTGISYYFSRDVQSSAIIGVAAYGLNRFL